MLFNSLRGIFALLTLAISTLSWAQRPNVVFVLADDFSSNLVAYMPHLQAMQKEGLSFDRYFVTNSLCCPSRATIFTGQMPHNTQVMTNEAPTGGYEAFVAHHNPAKSFAPALQAAGYKTAMMGKYLNGYHPGKHPIPVGWSDWFVVGGGGYSSYNYQVSDNGKLVHFGHRSTDYVTDVLAARADAFIRAAGAQPFFIEIATFAPHAPYTPAPRHAHEFSGLKAPRSPAFAWRAVANAPLWLRQIPALSAKDLSRLDETFRKRVQSVQAIEEMLGKLRATLAATGKTNTTYVVFSADNGLHLGEYSLRSGKMTPFDIDVRVPLIVAGPGVAQGRTSEALVANIDLAPTFAAWAGATLPSRTDGRSFADLLQGALATGGRQMLSIEHLNHEHRADDPDAPTPYGANPPTYTALRSANFLYVEYATGEMAYYDLSADPHQLNNQLNMLPMQKREQLHEALLAHKNCMGQTCRQAQDKPMAP